MKVFLISAMVAAVLPAAEIPAGTHILLEMVNTISTKTAQVGDLVYLRTRIPVVVEGEIALPVGSHVEGSVAAVTRSGRVKGRAALAVHLQTLTLPDGRILQFSPRLSSADSDGAAQNRLSVGNRVEHPSERGHDAAVIAVLAGDGAGSFGLAGGQVGAGWGSLIGAGIGTVVGSAVGSVATLVTRGGDVELVKGSTLEVTLDSPLWVE